MMLFFSYVPLTVSLGVSLVAADLIPILLAIAEAGLGDVPVSVKSQLQAIESSDSRTSGSDRCQLAVSVPRDNSRSGNTDILSAQSCQ